MANETILDTLMEIFNSANYRFRTVREITEQVQRRGFYTDVPIYTAMTRVLDHLCCDSASATYPFQSDEKGELWGLETWFPPKAVRADRKTARSSKTLSVGWETQHVVSIEKHELHQGIFPLRENLDRIRAGMDEWQREHAIISVRCYGSEEFQCALNSENRCLESKAL